MQLLFRMEIMPGLQIILIGDVLLKMLQEIKLMNCIIQLGRQVHHYI
jgi:hypothetical protein